MQHIIIIIHIHIIQLHEMERNCVYNIYLSYLISLSIYFSFS